MKKYLFTTKRLLARCFLLAALFLLTSSAFGQTKTILGNVVDSASGEPLSGASIHIIGKSKGVSAGSGGTFSLVANADDSLIISNVGYRELHVKVSLGGTMRILLASLTTRLADVVVVGYGTQKRSDITGSVVSLSKSRLSELPNTNALQALQGSVAGVNITQTSSAPGGTTTALVRGVNSISASTDPFIVVDGIPFSTTGGTINDISPADIASIEVLKDASAVAIYGTRGANGVILITTKHGQTGKAVVTYDVYGGPESFAHKVLPMGPQQYLQKYADWKMEAGSTNTNPLPNQFELNNYAAGITTNWLNNVSNPGNIQNHVLSVSGGSKDVQYYLSGNYFKENGVIKGYQYNRVSIRSNITATITKFLTVGTNIYLAANNYDGGQADLTEALAISPYGTYKNPDGSYAIYPMYPETNYVSPMLGLVSPRTNRATNINISGYAEVKIARGLKYRMNVAYSYLPTLAQTYTGRDANSLVGAASVANSETNNKLLENILSYELNMGKHHIDATGLYSAQQQDYFASSASATGFINDVLEYNNLAAGSTPSVTSNRYQTNLVSQMLRLNYSYASRYLFTATARRDGYSAFGDNTSKYGVFPSAAAGWNINKEKFMRNVKAVNALKLRVSYGLTGNQAISPNATSSVSTATNTVYNGLSTIGVYSSALGNSNLTWESTYGSNFGLDYTLFNSRISGTMDFYSTKTKNLLLYRSLPSASGYIQVLDNVGKVSNEGFEFSIRSQNIADGKFKWETSLNFSTNRNKILDLYGDKKSDIGNRWFIGHPVNVVYDYKKVGVWQQGENPSNVDPTAIPGDLKFADVNNDHNITAADEVIIGQSNPKWIGGITNTFHYRDFSLNIFIQTVQGVTKDNPMMDFWDLGGRQNLPANVGYWTPTNKSDSRPSLAYTNTRSYGYPEDASFTRLKDVTFSYLAPQKLVDAMKVGGLTLYVTGRNLFTLTKWTGWDPETDFNKLHTDGIHTNNGTYPLVRSIIIGANLSLR